MALVRNIVVAILAVAFYRQFLKYNDITKSKATVKEFYDYIIGE